MQSSYRIVNMQELYNWPVDIFLQNLPIIPL